MSTLTKSDAGLGRVFLPATGNSNGNGYATVVGPEPLTEEVKPAAINNQAEPVFESQVMTEIVAMVNRIARSDIPVMISGETGVGKEVIADLIHENSRPGKPFVKINCAALPRELIESELFGSQKGSFTGSQCNRAGLFREAGEGTIFLDEISEMAIDTQPKLLRVLQDGTVRPVGGNGTVFFPIHCRVITSTNRLPEEAIRDGKLRQDLFYRISAFGIHIPPLRERRQDIIPLAKAFLAKFASKEKRPCLAFTPPAEELMADYNWPGNVRQLESVVHGAVLMADSSLVDAGYFSSKLKGSPKNLPADKAGFSVMEQSEIKAIKKVLEQFAGTISVSADQLGIGRQTLYNKIKKYELGDFVRSLKV